MFGIVGGLIGSKYLAAEIAHRALQFTARRTDDVVAVDAQVAATLAALVAYDTTNAAGKRLIGEAVLTR